MIEDGIDPHTKNVVSEVGDALGKLRRERILDEIYREKNALNIDALLSSELVVPRMDTGSAAPERGGEDS